MSELLSRAVELPHNISHEWQIYFPFILAVES